MEGRVAKGRKSDGRVNNFNANRRLSSLLISKLDPLGLLQQIEDRRTYHPEGLQRPARAFKKAQHKLVAPKTRSSKVPQGVQFYTPGTILICVRRAVRREVLFAKNKGGGRHKRPRRNHYSDVQC